MNHLMVYCQSKFQSYKAFSFFAFVTILFFFFSEEIKAEAFTINHYNVKIELRDNGSFHVTETIDLRFHESRRGILRSIPIVYRDGASVAGQSGSAVRPIGPTHYQIVLEEIHVEGHQFTYYKEGDNKIIRIGNPNRRVRGSQQYIISYTVWGGLNEFEDTVEWPWNIIGNEWDAPIERVSFEIQSQGSIRFSENDIVVATGRRGMQDRDVQLQVTPNSISGESTRSLRPFEGISIVTRHPKTSFSNIHIPIEKLAKDYWIRNQDFSFELLAPGYVKVKEEIELEVLNPLSSISRLVAYSAENRQRETPTFPFIQNLKVSSAGKQLEATWNRADKFTRIVIEPSEGNSFSGRQLITLEYKLYGIDHRSAGGEFFRVFPAHFLPAAPVNNLDVRGRGQTSDSFTFLAGRKSATQKASSDSYAMRFEYPSVRPEYGVIQIAGKSGIFQEDKQPIQVFGWNYVVESMDIDVDINNRQLVDIKREYNVVNSYIMPENSFEPVFQQRFKVRSDYFSSTFIPSSWNLLDRRVRPISRMEAENGSFTGMGGGYQTLETPVEFRNSESWTNSDKISYSGLFTKDRESDEAILRVPLVSKTADPLKELNIRINGDQLSSRDLVSARIKVGQNQSIPLEFRNGDWVSGKPVALAAGESAVLEVRGPQGFAGRLGVGDSIYLFLRNNVPIWLIFIVGFVLYFLWNRIGRNEKEAVVVQFYPPEKITSAEAGLLWDDKLHRKDLVSLVYYWAGKGHLEVEEVGEGKSMDYRFRKLKDLPKDARLFEKTFFGGLFFKDEVLLSELRRRFAGTMRLAHKDLMEHSKKNDFYVPGSRGFGCALKSLGILLLLFGVFGLGIAFFTGYWSYAVAPLTISVLLLVFGKMMPKKGPFGFKKYQKLLGFREFVRTAEIDRIKALYKDNPGYFDKTIAYAIVFGLGKQWAEKFEGLMTEPPSWYKSNRRGADFSTIYFTNALINSMHRMNYNMSLPSASSGGGGSSWSGSGGGSGFGGSFGSGGGFGGGGGSSW